MHVVCLFFYYCFILYKFNLFSFFVIFRNYTLLDCFMTKYEKIITTIFIKILEFDLQFLFVTFQNEKSHGCELNRGDEVYPPKSGTHRIFVLILKLCARSKKKLLGKYFASQAFEVKVRGNKIYPRI